MVYRCIYCNGAYCAVFSLLKTKIMEEKVLVDNKAVPVSDTTVKFGVLDAPKPKWATWMFRAVAILTTVVAFWIGSTRLISDENKVEIILGLKAIDMLVLGFANLFGVVVPEESK